MGRDKDRCTLDPGRTALAPRGLSKPASYPVVEQHLGRRRAAGRKHARCWLPLARLLEHGEEVPQESVRQRILRAVR
jgi:hypothetical protein